jgi:hypothetical protein
MFVYSSTFDFTASKQTFIADFYFAELVLV